MEHFKQTQQIYKTIYNENHTEQLDTNNQTLRYPVDFLLLTVTFSLACLSPEHNVQNSMYVCMALRNMLNAFGSLIYIF